MQTKISYKNEIKPDDKITPDQIVNRILKNRKIKNTAEFLNPSSPLNIKLSDFCPSVDGFKKEITKTLNILNKIKNNNEIIVVYTDYDADGITGGAILWETLHLLGFKVMPYVPHRKHEGYGFSKIGIDNVKKQFNPSLIISVDHGITAKEKVAYAKSLGISIIVTDHHIKPDELPTEAEAIFHIPELSGSGVAYFFAKEIFNNHINKIASPDKNVGIAMTKLEENFKTDYLALASIGTVADLVPLVGPSRSIVKYGLEAFQKTKRVGLKHILKEAGIDEKPITSYEIGFIIAPRINAVGRLEHAIDALRLLCTKDEKRAMSLASHVGLKNRERQDIVKKAVEEAINVIQYKLLTIENSKAKQVNFYSAICVEEIIKKQDFFTLAGNKNLPASDIGLPKLIILVSNKWHEGIIGLIASKITEKYYGPTIVLTKVDGFYKGSARSIPGFDITKFLRSLKKYLVDIGGHTQAAGFTIEEKNITSFTTIVGKVVNKFIKDKDLEKVITADLKIPVSKATFNLVKLLEKLAPFGIGNPNPLFYSNAQIVHAAIFGRKNEHLKIYIKDNNGKPLKPNLTQPLELMSFYGADKFTELSRGKIIDIVYNLEINRWNEKENVRGKIVNLS